MFFFLLSFFLSRRKPQQNAHKMKNKYTDAADRRTEKNGCDACMCENVFKSRTVEPNINKNMNIIIYDWPLYLYGKEWSTKKTPHKIQHTVYTHSIYTNCFGHSQIIYSPFIRFSQGYYYQMTNYSILSHNIVYCNINDSI